MTSPGVRRQLTTAATPQQNGVAERKNRSILNKVWYMMIGTGFPKNLWAEAVQTATYLLNCQKSYVLGILDDLDLVDYNPAQTPMESSLDLCTDMHSPMANGALYPEVVEKLLYLTNTRPDISFSVSTVCRFQKAPQLTHLKAVKRIARYLKGSADLGILFKHGDITTVRGFTGTLFPQDEEPPTLPKLDVYTDADWAGEKQTQRATCGFLFKSGDSPLSWHSKRQTTVALSSTESEYQALQECTKEVCWLRSILSEINLLNTGPTVIWCDNQSMLKSSKNPIFHARTKHIEVHFHFVREKIIDGTIEAKYIPSGLQLADIFTKALGRAKFLEFRELIGLKSLQNFISS
ncbi:hypothetical protein R1sor_011970 [Riccia sorocarpa]|uniref:Integrase catalytic domain-containing protein n=1 Tax=Riccia sorocarpa TaxID=122646 RepID=A0ABD3I8L1_9MARC